MKLRNKLIGTLFALFATAFSDAALAEPDDTVPFSKFGVFQGYVHMMSSADRSVPFVGETISSATDVDYLVLSCGNKHFVAEVDVSLFDSTGDLDIEVYGIEGNLLGGSRGTTKYEVASVSAHRLSTVVLKVYGYLGATGDYYAYLYCW